MKEKMEELTPDSFLEISQYLTHQDLVNLLRVYPEFATERFYEMYLQRKYLRGLHETEDFWVEPYGEDFSERFPEKLELRPGNTWQDVFERGLLVSANWEEYWNFISDQLREYVKHLTSPYKIWIVVEDQRMVPVIARDQLEIMFQSTQRKDREEDKVIGSYKHDVMDVLPNWIYLRETLRYGYVMFEDILPFLKEIAEKKTYQPEEGPLKGDYLFGPVLMGLPDHGKLILQDKNGHPLNLKY